MEAPVWNAVSTTTDKMTVTTVFARGTGNQSNSILDFHLDVTDDLLDEFGE